MTLTTDSFKERNLKTILCVLLIFSAITDATVYYFKEDSLTGELTAPGPLSTLRLVFLVLFYLYYFLFNKFNLNNVSLSIIFFIFFVFLSVLTSEYFSKSLYSYIKITLSMLIYIPFYNLFKNEDDIRLLFKTVFYINIIFIAQFLIANIYKLDYVASYVSNIIYFGGSFISVPKTLTYNIFFLIIAGKSIKRKYKVYFNFVLFISIIVVILYLNRSSILALFLGILLLVIYMRKFKLIYPIVATVIVYFFIAGIYEYEMNKIFDTRIKNREFKEEGRFIELELVLNDFLSKSFKHSLMGSYAFASERYNFQTTTFRATRALHTDYGIVLHGVGIIGFIFYFLIYKRIFTYYDNLKLFNDNFNKEAKIIFKVFPLTMIVMAYGGFIEYLGSMLNFFAILGGLSGLSKNFLNKK